MNRSGLQYLSFIAGAMAFGYGDLSHNTYSGHHNGGYMTKSKKKRLSPVAEKKRKKKNRDQRRARNK